MIFPVAVWINPPKEQEDISEKSSLNSPTEVSQSPLHIPERRHEGVLLTVLVLMWIGCEGPEEPMGLQGEQATYTFGK